MNPEPRAPTDGATATSEPGAKQDVAHGGVPDWVRAELPRLTLRAAPEHAAPLDEAADVYDVVLTPSAVKIVGKTISTASISKSGRVQLIEELALELRKVHDERSEAGLHPPAVRFWVDKSVSPLVLESVVQAAARERFRLGKLVVAHGEELRQLSFVCQASEVPGQLRLIGRGDARLPPEVIQKEVRAHFDGLRACYTEGLGRDPKLTGVVVVRFVIGRDGSVTHVGSAEGGDSPMKDEAVVTCVLEEFRKLKFPQPEDGIVKVTYPIHFSPEEVADGATPTPSTSSPAKP